MVGYGMNGSAASRHANAAAAPRADFNHAGRVLTPAPTATHATAMPTKMAVDMVATGERQRRCKGRHARSRTNLLSITSEQLHVLPIRSVLRIYAPGTRNPLVTAMAPAMTILAIGFIMIIAHRSTVCGAPVAHDVGGGDSTHPREVRSALVCSRAGHTKPYACRARTWADGASLALACVRSRARRVRGYRGNAPIPTPLRGHCVGQRRTPPGLLNKYAAPL